MAVPTSTPKTIENTEPNVINTGIPKARVGPLFIKYLGKNAEPAKKTAVVQNIISSTLFPNYW